MAMRHGRPILPVHYDIERADVPNSDNDRDSFWAKFRGDPRVESSSELERWWNNLQHLRAIEGMFRADSTRKDADIPLLHSVVDWLQEILKDDPFSRAPRQESSLARVPSRHHSACNVFHISNQQLVSRFEWMSNTVFGIRRMKFRNQLTQPVSLWVFDDPGQLCIQTRDDDAPAAEQSPTLARRATLTLRNHVDPSTAPKVDPQPPIQSLVVPVGATFGVHLRLDRTSALITFGVRGATMHSSNGRSTSSAATQRHNELLILQHHREVQINQIFAFQPFHLEFALWEIAVADIKSA